MESLQVGDRVQVMKGDGSLGISDVCFWAHRDLQASMDCHKIQAGSACLPASMNHLVPVAISIDEGSVQYRHAKDVQVGDMVFTAKRNDTISKAFVTSVDIETMRGRFAPCTTEGTIVVNGVCASCYSDVPTHLFGHVAVWPMRTLYKHGLLLQEEGGYMSHKGKELHGAHTVFAVVATRAARWFSCLRT